MSFQKFRVGSTNTIANQPNGGRIYFRSSDSGSGTSLTITGADETGAPASEANDTFGQHEVVTAGLWNALRAVNISAVDAGLISVYQEGAKAAGYIVVSTQPADGDTIEIGLVGDTQGYTYKTTLTGDANEVKIGANVSATAANLSAAINAGSGAGTTYGTGTVANGYVTASVTASMVTVTDRIGCNRALGWAINQTVGSTLGIFLPVGGTDGALLGSLTPGVTEITDTAPPDVQLFIDLESKSVITNSIENLGIPINSASQKPIFFLGDRVALDVFFLLPGATDFPRSYQAQRFPEATVKIALGVFDSPEGGFFQLRQPSMTIEVESIVDGLITTTEPHNLVLGQGLRFTALTDPEYLDTSTNYFVYNIYSPTTFYLLANGNPPGNLGGNASAATIVTYPITTNAPFGTQNVPDLDNKGTTFEATAEEVQYALRNVRLDRDGNVGPPPFTHSDGVPLWVFNNIVSIGGMVGVHEAVVTGTPLKGYLIQLPGTRTSQVSGDGVETPITAEYQDGGNFPQLVGVADNLIPECVVINETLHDGNYEGVAELQYIRFEVAGALQGVLGTEIAFEAAVTVIPVENGDGSAIHEVQQVNFNGLRAGGYFTLTFSEGTTAPIDFSANGGQIAVAINNLLGLGAVTVEVFSPYLFEITWADFTNHAQVSVDISNLQWLYGWSGVLDFSGSGIEQLVLRSGLAERSDVLLEVELTPDGAGGPTTALQTEVTVRRDIIRGS